MAPEDGAPWSEARTKRVKSSLQERLKHLDGEAVRQVLRQKPPAEERSQSVGVLSAHFELCRAARESPVVAWKALLRSFGCPKPVWISLINACTAELYFEDKDMSTAREVLVKERVLVERPRLAKVGKDRSGSGYGPSDADRRRVVYEKAYFRPLRHAALIGLAKEDIRILLDAVEWSAERMKDRVKRKQHLFHIRVDRELFLQEGTGGDSSGVDGVEVEAGVASQQDEGSALD
jgi:hypothetical protein